MVGLWRTRQAGAIDIAQEARILFLDIFVNSSRLFLVCFCCIPIESFNKPCYPHPEKTDA